VNHESAKILNADFVLFRGRDFEFSSLGAGNQVKGVML